MKKGVGRGAPGAAGVGNREAFKQMMEELEAKVIHFIQKERGSMSSYLKQVVEALRNDSDSAI